MSGGYNTWEVWYPEGLPSGEVAQAEQTSHEIERHEEPGVTSCSLGKATWLKLDGGSVGLLTATPPGKPQARLADLLSLSSASPFASEARSVCANCAFYMQTKRLSMALWSVFSNVSQEQPILPRCGFTTRDRNIFLCGRRGQRERSGVSHLLERLRKILRHARSTAPCPAAATAKRQARPRAACRPADTLASARKARACRKDSTGWYRGPTRIKRRFPEGPAPRHRLPGCRLLAAKATYDPEGWNPLPAPDRACAVLDPHDTACEFENAKQGIGVQAAPAEIFAFHAISVFEQQILTEGRREAQRFIELDALVRLQQR